MSLRRREELLQIAREYDALIITDDVYDFLQWPSKVASETEVAAVEQAHLPRIVDVDRYLDGGTERPGADGLDVVGVRAHRNSSQVLQKCKSRPFLV
jgi:hypothetical protein